MSRLATWPCCDCQRPIPPAVNDVSPGDTSLTCVAGIVTVQIARSGSRNPLKGPSELQSASIRNPPCGTCTTCLLYTSPSPRD
eukprot:14708095-Alexandrium_andersonii.AAC.1